MKPLAALVVGLLVGWKARLVVAALADFLDAFEEECGG